jgi:hypothetical protein
VLGLPLTLTPDQKATFLRLIEAERARNRLMAYEARNTLHHFAALGMNVEQVRIAARTDKDSLAWRTCVANHLN